MLLGTKLGKILCVIKKWISRLFITEGLLMIQSMPVVVFRP